MTRRAVNVPCSTAAILLVAVSISCGGGGIAPGGSTDPTSIDPIQLALVFNYHVTDPAQQQGFSFVWGAAPNTSYPGLTRTYYQTFDRSGWSDATMTVPLHDLSWFQANHPTWVVYQCDGVTPAWYSDGTGEKFVPIDITNPEVIAYQRSQLPADYAGIASDNVTLENHSGRCGTHDTQGVFHVRWNGSDPQYRADIVDWAAALQPTIINFDYDFSDATDSDALLSKVDNWLDECGFTFCGAGRLTGAAWQAKISVLSQWEKGLVLVAETPSDPTPDDVEWALANLLLVQHDHTYAYISRIQNYGGVPVWLLQLTQGHPVGTPIDAAGSNPRRFTNGVAVVNPSASQPLTIALDGSYHDLYGTAHTDSVTLPPASGLVLVR